MAVVAVWMALIAAVAVGVEEVWTMTSNALLVWLAEKRLEGSAAGQWAVEMPRPRAFAWRAQRSGCSCLRPRSRCQETAWNEG